MWLWYVHRMVSNLLTELRMFLVWANRKSAVELWANPECGGQEDGSGVLLGTVAVHILDCVLSQLPVSHPAHVLTWKTETLCICLCFWCRHPLFPLLALLFERCEQATQSAECPNSESFNMDIQAFVQHQERDRKPFLLNDPEVDGLVSKKVKWKSYPTKDHEGPEGR